MPPSHRQLRRRRSMVSMSGEPGRGVVRPSASSCRRSRRRTSWACSRASLA
jgi:hypothetical protein